MRPSEEFVEQRCELAVLRCEQCGNKERDLERTEPDAFLNTEYTVNGTLVGDLVSAGDGGLNEPANLLLTMTRIQNPSTFMTIGFQAVAHRQRGWTSRH